MDKKEKTSEGEEVHKIFKIHISFEARVLLLVFATVILFAAACTLMISTLSYHEVSDIGYVENAEVHYQVCMKNENCMEEDLKYPTQTIESIPSEFHYDISYDEEISSDVTYYIVALHRIYDEGKSNKIVFEDEDFLVERTTASKRGADYQIDQEIPIDYAKYAEFVQDYQKKYSSSAKSTLDVILYVDDGSDVRNVAQIGVPIGLEEIQITHNGVSSREQVYSLEQREWSNHSTLYIVLGAFLILLSLLFLFRLTRLVLVATGKRSKYQQILKHILTEYDDLIVNVREDYMLDTKKKIIKLDSFKELVDARNILSKPIFYMKINNVKSEFIVEDEEIIYQFVLKEADLAV